MKKMIYMFATVAVAAVAMSCPAGAASMTENAEVVAMKAPKGEIKTVVFVTNMHCQKCVNKVNDNIAFEKGVKDMKGVEVISGGDFIISNATFPTYFIKGTDELAAQTKLDATIFATRIAPALNITVRFVGEEPTDKTTLAYNQAMREVFAENGIELKVIPREQKGDQIVSASSVRRALAADDWETVYRMASLTADQSVPDAGTFTLPDGTALI